MNEERSESESDNKRETDSQPTAPSSQPKSYPQRTTGKKVARKLFKDILAESLEEETERSNNILYHKCRLDKLLSSNNLKRVPVYGDGDCIFKAFLKSGNYDIQTDLCRTMVCDHLNEYKENYNQAIVVVPPDDHDSAFSKNVEDLRKMGHWNSQLCDAVPLALANVFRTHITIYSSNTNVPMKSISPDIASVPSFSKPVPLAVTECQGEEHYDAVVDADGTERPRNILGTLNDITVLGPLHVIDDVRDSINKKKSQTECVAGEDSSNEAEKETVKETILNYESMHCRDLHKNIMPSRQGNKENEPVDESPAPSETPAKQLSNATTSQTSSSRKRQRHPETWKRNIHKKENLSGKGKKVLPCCTSGCRHRCKDNISDADREAIFLQYYKLGSYERQNDYICQLTEGSSPHRGNGKRKVSYKYHLIDGSNNKIQVCRDFFCKTFAVSKKKVYTAMALKIHGVFRGSDMRGKHEPVNKTPADTLQFVRSHIESFPKVESHYCRKNSCKEYLDQSLNITKMYQLYTQECGKENKTPVTESRYRNVFCTEYNLSFFKPKKDLCSTCSSFDNQNKENISEELQEHLQKKEEARAEKEKDKLMAKESSSHYVGTFDLQQVLSTPSCNVSDVYYSRKIQVYNLTFYNIKDGETFCHVWNETQAKRGSNEIATCMSKTITSCASHKEIQHITFYSDNCPGQNHNQYVACAMLHTLSLVSSSLKTINHKFLLAGHSQMECDSVHSSIETAKKKTDVFVPSEWNNIIKLSRRHKPYHVIPLANDEVKNYKLFVTECCSNFKAQLAKELGSRWASVRWIQVRSTNPRSIFVNYSFDESKFHEIPVQGTTRRGRPPWPANIPRAYSAKLAVDVKKKEDLMKLCRKGIIPSEHHSFYSSLATL